MLEEKYRRQITEILARRLTAGDRAFIFGSSLRSSAFADGDIGLLGASVTHATVCALAEDFEESLLPYFVDIVNFNDVDESFRETTLQGEVAWLI